MNDRTTRKKAHQQAEIARKKKALSDVLLQTDLLTKQQIAECLQVGERTITNLMRQKLIPYVAVGPRVVRFRRLQVIAALERKGCKDREEALAARQKTRSEPLAA